MGIWLFLLLANRTAAPTELTFSDFQSAVDAGDVKTAEFLLGDGVIRGELSNGESYEVAYVEEIGRAHV